MSEVDRINPASNIPDMSPDLRQHPKGRRYKAIEAVTAAIKKNKKFKGTGGIYDRTGHIVSKELNLSQAGEEEKQDRY